MMCGGLSRKRGQQLLLLIALLPLASAQDISILDVEVTLDSSGNAFVSQAVSFDSTSAPTIKLPAENPQVVRVYDLTGDLAYTLEDSGVVFSARDASSDYTATVEYFTTDLTSKNGNQWSLLYETALTYDVENYILTLKLPENTSISSHEPAGVISSEGGSLMVEWYLESVAAGEEKHVSVDYTIGASHPTTTTPTTLPATTLPSTTIPEKPAGDGKTLQYVFAVLLITLLAVVFPLLSRLFRKKDRRPPDGGAAVKEEDNTQPEDGELDGAVEKTSKGQDDVLVTLNKNEREIVNEVLEAGGRLTQAEVFRKTGIPKATLSRSLRKLEQRKILEIRDIGYTNLVVATDWFKGL